MKYQLDRVIIKSWSTGGSANEPPYGDELYIASETVSSADGGDDAGSGRERPIYFDGRFLPARDDAKGDDGTDAGDGTFDSADLITVFQAGEYAAPDPADDFML